MSIKVISNWYTVQYILLCSVFKENKRRMDMCVADHGLIQNFTLSFQIDGFTKFTKTRQICMHNGDVLT